MSICIDPVCVEARVSAETELDCISDVATGARPIEDFQPARGVLGEVIVALTLLREAATGQRYQQAPSNQPGSPDEPPEWFDGIDMCNTCGNRWPCRAPCWVARALALAPPSGL